MSGVNSTAGRRLAGGEAGHLRLPATVAFRLAWAALALLALVAAMVALPSRDAAAAAPTQKRVALVVGNSSYQHTPKLPNPVNDATDMAASLAKLGFQVIKGTDLDLRSMQARLEDFARAARDSDVALIFYAGHGLQYLGSNYIVPVDAELSDDISLDYQTLQMDELLRALDRSGGVKILILDACRNLALGDRPGQSSAVRTGFAKFDARRNMVVAYSTVATEAAFDGTSRNSFFTGAILGAMEEPGLEIGQLFRRVAAEVSQRTKGRQVPEVSRTLTDEFYFNRGETDAEAWAQLRSSTEPGDFRTFVQRFPKSFFVDDAKGRILQIENEREAAATIARIEEMRRQARAEPPTPGSGAPVMGDTAIVVPPAASRAKPAGTGLKAAAANLDKARQERMARTAGAGPGVTEMGEGPGDPADRLAIEQEEEALRAAHLAGNKLAATELKAVAGLPATDTRSVEPEPAATWSSILPPQSPRERILLRTAQEELIRLGCLAGEADGQMDRATDIGLKRFGEASYRFRKRGPISEDMVRALMTYGGRLCWTPCARSGKTCS